MITVTRTERNRYDEFPEDSYASGKNFAVETGYLYVIDERSKPVAVYNSNEWSFATNEV